VTIVSALCFLSIDSSTIYSPASPLDKLTNCQNKVYTDPFWVYYSIWRNVSILTDGN